MKKHFATRLQLLVTIALAMVFVRAAHADVIMDWNAKGDAIAAEKQFLLQTRVMSMLHIAMFEAVNAIEPRYAPYKLTLSADRATSKDAAAATAAHDVLLSIYPDQKVALDVALGERRPLIGQRGLVAQQRDGARVRLAAQGCGNLESRLPRPDNHNIRHAECASIVSAIATVRRAMSACSRSTIRPSS